MYLRTVATLMDSFPRVSEMGVVERVLCGRCSPWESVFQGGVMMVEEVQCFKGQYKVVKRFTSEAACTGRELM